MANTSSYYQLMVESGLKEQVFFRETSPEPRRSTVSFASHGVNFGEHYIVQNIILSFP